MADDVMQPDQPEGERDMSKAVKATLDNLQKQMTHELNWKKGDERSPKSKFWDIVNKYEDPACTMNPTINQAPVCWNVGESMASSQRRLICRWKP